MKRVSSRRPRAASAPRSRRVVPPSVAVMPADLFRLLFENSNDAQYIIPLDSETFTEVNPAFERLTGYSRRDLLSGRVKAEDTVAEESLTVYRQKEKLRKKMSTERYPMRVRGPDGTTKRVEVSVRRMEIDGRLYIIGSLRDLSDHDAMKRKLRDQVCEQGRVNLRIMALTEKIRTVPEGMPQLLQAKDEPRMLRQAGDLLTDRRGLACESATFYLAADGFLVPGFTTMPLPPKRLDLHGRTLPARIWRGEAPPVLEGPELILPLVGKNETVGIVEATLSRKELALLDENAAARKAYQNLLVTFADLLGLLIENRRLYDRVRLQSLVDPLTQAYNRRYFDARVKDEVQRALRYGRDLSLIIADVDRFKEVNDLYGHPCGDGVLQAVAEMFRKTTRSVDVVGRYGGDEFVMLLPETSQARAVEKAEYLRRRVRESPLTRVGESRQEVRCTLSLGVSSLGPCVTTLDQLLKCADEALYRAKQRGRDRVCGAGE